MSQLHDLIKAYERRLIDGQVEIFYALREKHDLRIASAFKAQRKRVDELRWELTHVTPASRAERKALPYVRQALYEAATGLHRLERGYRLPRGDPQHQQRTDQRRSQFEAAVKAFGRAHYYSKYVGKGVTP